MATAEANATWDTLYPMSPRRHISVRSCFYVYEVAILESGPPGAFRGHHAEIETGATGEGSADYPGAFTWLAKP
jgi:hypothetical protein